MARVSVTISADGMSDDELRGALRGVLAALTVSGQLEALDLEIHDEPHPASRSAVTGQYITEAEAEANPETSVREGGE